MNLKAWGKGVCNSNVWHSQAVQRWGMGLISVPDNSSLLPFPPHTMSCPSWDFPGVRESPAPAWSPAQGCQGSVFWLCLEPHLPFSSPQDADRIVHLFFFNSYFTNSTASCVLYPIGVIAVTIFNRLAYISFALGDGIIRQRNRHGFLQYWGVLLSIHKHSFFVKIKQNRLTRNNYSQYGQNYLPDCISIHPICPVRFWLTWG